MTSFTPPPEFGRPDRAGGWQAEAAGATSDRNGRPVQVFNLRYLPGFLNRRRTTATDPAASGTADRVGGWLLAGAALLLLALALAQGYVSYRAQYQFVHAVKREHLASTLEALGLDAAAVIFALLALAQARLGRPAVAERTLNLACVAGSLLMNALSADVGSAKSVAAWVLPAALYAAASDRLIAVVRRRALAGRDNADTTSPLAAARGIGLWVLRLGLAPVTTCKGFRAWVLDEAPVAPGRRALPAPGAGTGPSALPSAERPALEAGPSTAPETGPSGSSSTPSTSPTAGPSTVTGRTGRGTRKAPSGGRSRRSSRTTARTEPDVTALLPLGRRIAADLAARGEALTRDTLAAQLRQAGHTAGNARVGALLTHLKTDAPAPSTADPNASPSETTTATEGQAA
ncbi:hypothetical protein [Actinomadura rupiterrae]|uniref:hypothetical protein n=1 Tax=Actinomadura rupiterrae TaxID=559627 RepID=UPI0020A27193|nr:hypothetical protein [Actinomadura rupiterrae]MCP2336976.1 hypothetical protein [Actinomadura rupiterrae]